MRNIKIFITAFIITLGLFAAAGCFIMLSAGGDTPKEKIETVFMPAFETLSGSRRVGEAINEEKKPAEALTKAGDAVLYIMPINKRIGVSVLLLTALNLPWPF